MADAEDAGGVLESDASNVSQRPKRKNAIIPVLGLLLLVNLAMSLYQLPLNRVIERRLCRDYYASTDPAMIQPGGSVDEQLCKIDAVQKSLGWIQGVMDTIWIGGDFFMTIPLVFLSEKLGSRTVLHFNLLSRGFMLSWAIIVGYYDFLPTKAITLGPTLSVLGGDCVFNSMTYALASDLTDDLVLRGIYFGYMSSISYVVALLGPALASATMTLMLWLPFWLGISLLVLAVSVIQLLPTSQQQGLERQRQQQQQQPSVVEEQREPLLSSPQLKAQESRSLLQSSLDRFRVLQLIITSHPRNFSLLLFSFFLTSLASSDTKLLVQYISKRYSWSFASAGYLLSGKAVVNLVLLTVVIPRFLQSRRGARTRSGDSANVLYAIVCLLISAVGALGIAFSAKIWALVPWLLVYALGSALPVFTLSLLKSSAICPPHRNDDVANPETHIFSIVMLIKTVGSLVGAPTMAMLWVRGIGMGGFALGLPYFVSATCYTVALVVFRGIKVD